MENNLLNSLMKAYLGQISSALQIAEIISEHNNEEKLSTDSLITGLVYRLMVPMEDNEVTEYLDKAEEIIDDILNGNRESSDDSYSSGEESEEEIKSKIKTNHCNCDICSKARVCLINFNDYEVNDDLARIFKDSIIII